MAISGYRLPQQLSSANQPHQPQQPQEHPQQQQQSTSPSELLKNRIESQISAAAGGGGVTTGGPGGVETTATQVAPSSSGGGSMLDMWAASKTHASEAAAASASNSSTSSIGGPRSTPPISDRGDRGSISTPGSIKGRTSVFTCLVIFVRVCFIFIFHPVASFFFSAKSAIAL